MGRRLTANAGFDGIELADPAQGLDRHGRACGFDDLIELASRVAPARSKSNVVIGCELLEASISIDMQDTFEARKMRDRPFSLAIRCEQIDRCRRFRSAPRPLLAGIDPKTPGLRSPAAGIEHGDRRVVGKQVVGGEHVLAQPFMQRFEPPARAANPADQRRTAEIDAVPGKICDCR